MLTPQRLQAGIPPAPRFPARALSLLGAAGVAETGYLAWVSATACSALSAHHVLRRALIVHPHGRQSSSVVLWPVLCLGAATLCSTVTMP